MSNVIQIERSMDMAPAAMTPLTPMAMISQAIAQGADLSMVQQLMDLQDRNDAKLARRAFDAALAAAKASIPVIRKNKTVAFEAKGSGAKTNYVHEDLGEVARTVDPVLAQHGLSYRFRPEQRECRVRVTCILSHVDGHSEESTLEAGADTTGNKNSIQAVGSTITYLQRYTLKMALGLAAAEDDDARAAGAPAAPTTITDAQVSRIRSMLKDAGATEQEFCTFCKVDGLSDIFSDRFDRAVNVLQGRIADRQKNGGQS